MKKLLIAVKSCLRDVRLGYNQVIRDTWGKDFNGLADVKFFIGDVIIEPLDEKDYRAWKNLKSDERPVPCIDNYDNLPYKTKAILERTLFLDYEYVFLCDTDTFLVPSKLLNCGYQNYDYAGRFGNMPAIGTTFTYVNDGRGNRIENCHPWCSGGVGYFLSNKAARIIAKEMPNHWAEDLWVGQVLGKYIQSGEIKAWDISEFECNAAWHFPRRAYNNEVYSPAFGWMEKMQKEFGE